MAIESWRLFNETKRGRQRTRQILAPHLGRKFSAMCLMKKKKCRQLYLREEEYSSPYGHFTHSQWFHKRHIMPKTHATTTQKKQYNITPTQVTKILFWPDVNFRKNPHGPFILFENVQAFHTSNSQLISKKKKGKKRKDGTGSSFSSSYIGCWTCSIFQRGKKRKKRGERKWQGGKWKE
jgi:hypothetical protein